MVYVLVATPSLPPSVLPMCATVSLIMHKLCLCPCSSRWTQLLMTHFMHAVLCSLVPLLCFMSLAPIAGILTYTHTSLHLLFRSFSLQRYALFVFHRMMLKVTPPHSCLLYRAPLYTGRYDVHKTTCLLLYVSVSHWPHTVNVLTAASLDRQETCLSSIKAVALVCLEVYSTCTDVAVPTWQTHEAGGTLQERCVRLVHVCSWGCINLLGPCLLTYSMYM